MILASLADSARYEQLHPLFKTAFDFIKSNHLLEREPGRIDLDGNRLFINNVKTNLIKREKQALEIHKKYIDIHIPLDKTEIIGWKSLSDLNQPREEFDTENDFALFDEPATNYIEVHPGEFLIVFPEDAHAPVIGEGALRKLIVKIEL